MVREKITVVVVDDEPIIRMDIVNLLENAGHIVIGQGSDGYEAIELCQRLRPDAILLDIKMELLDGISAAKIISEECLESAIILLTGFNKGEYMDQANDCRISSYLVKPIDENQLLMNIELAVARNKELLKYVKDINKIYERLESRKKIEIAKGLLMSRRGLSENDAYNHIREISRVRNISMNKVATIILRQYGE